MIRLSKKWLIYAAFLAALLVLAGIGVTAAKALWPAAAVHPANGDSNLVFDAVARRASPRMKCRVYGDSVVPRLGDFQRAEGFQAYRNALR